MICIYTIVNILDDKQYVGQAKDKDERWREHRKRLRGYYHHSILLQRAWCKHGEDNFIFVVLENLDHIQDLSLVEQKVILDSREQWWMDTLKSEYNIAKVAGSMLGYKHTEDARNNMSKSHIGKKHHSPEYLEKLSERMKGNKHAEGQKHTPERIEARAIT